MPYARGTQPVRCCECGSTSWDDEYERTMTGRMCPGCVDTLGPAAEVVDLSTRRRYADLPEMVA